MRNRRLRRPCVFAGAWRLLAIGLLVPQMVFADMIALRDGTRLEGIVANRELVASNPTTFEYVSILIGGDGELRRILVADIEYVLLVDGEQERLVDFTSAGAKSAPTSGTASEAISERSSTTTGVGLMAFGGAALAVGALVKFGGPKATVTETDLDYEQDSYNAANYVMMVAGGALFVAGFALLIGSLETPSETKNAFLDLREGNTRVGVSFKF